MIVISVEGIPSVDKAAELLLRYSDQIPFATSLAINRVGEFVRDFIANQYLPSKMTIRRAWNKPRTRFGINLQPSTKRNLEAHIFTRAPWLKLQEEGGTKTAGQFEDITMPEKSLRQTQDRLIPKSIQPSKVMANMAKFHAFQIGGTIFQRTGPGKGDIRPLFFLKQSAHVIGKLGMKDKAIELVQQQYDQEWGKALAYAIATSNHD